MQSIGIFATEITEPIVACIEKLKEHFSQPDYNIIIYDKEHESEANSNCPCFCNLSQLNNPLFVISIGGDGTFIKAAHCVSRSNIPLVGINYGRMGFLADISNNEIEHFAETIKTGKYTIEKRSFLEVSTSQKTEIIDNLALNEVCVTKKDSAHLMTIHSWINNDYLGALWADGIIIATPTGSTAYSLSIGGSIIAPSSNSFIINTIAPHSLNVRPIIISDDSVITIQIEGRDKHYNLSLDSSSEGIEKENIITIKKSKIHLQMIKLEGKSYFDTLRNKLMWGQDVRN